MQEYFYWFLRSDVYGINMALLMTGSCQFNFGPSHLSQTSFILPTILDQKSISSFLDSKTSEIDQTIEKDKKLIELLKKNDIRGILNMDENLIEQAGECGYRSIVVLLGAISEFKISDLEFQILSYEGPFGVGYLVANIKGL